MAQTSSLHSDGVSAALRWLLGPRATLTQRNLLVSARQAGLIMLGKQGIWSANSAKIEARIRRLGPRLPRDPHQLGQIIHGLGEIAAHSHADIYARLIRMLPRRRATSWKTVLSAAADAGAGRKFRNDLQTLAFAQWVMRSRLSWNTLYEASLHIEHPGTVITGRYGLMFAVRVAMILAPAELDRWIRAHRNSDIVAAAGEAVLAIVTWNESAAAKRNILSMGVPALSTLAIADLVATSRGEALSTSEAFARLDAAGYDRADAIWMLGLRLKSRLHSRFRTRGVIGDAEQRLAQLKAKPNLAAGGPSHAAADISSTTQRLHDGRSQCQTIEADLETLLFDLANHWPEAGLSGEQLSWLSQSFVAPGEIAYRLAFKLSPSLNRSALLKGVVADFASEIGLEDPESSFDRPYHLGERRFAEAAPWAARAHIALHETGAKDIGKAAGHLIFKMASQVDALCEIPFLASRRPMVWRSAFHRGAHTLRFAG